jgi:hypothetical protein
MASAPDFAKFVPGFDFMQGLLRSAGHVLPDMGKWVAPTLDPEELGQRIEQLKTVQMWLEQNARMLGATVQALEVQRMTLATLKSMNVRVADLGQALQARAPAPEPARADAAPAAASPAASASGAARTRPGGRARAAAPDPAPQPAGGPGAAPMVDPMQWWGALTQQFTQLAAQAVKDGPVEAARSAASQFADVAARATQGAPAAAPATRTAARKRRAPSRAPRSKQT